MTAGVVIVNFNSAQFAIDAALSVLGDDCNAIVVIVDNASVDNSVDYFRSLSSASACHVPCAPDSDGPKPVTFARIEDIHVQFIGRGHAVIDEPGLYIIESDENRGFAAGCNIGLRALSAENACSWYLLLNPDALVATGAMNAFEVELRSRRVGLIGGSVLEFDAPHRIQALGGARLNPITFMGENIGGGGLFRGSTREPSSPDQLTYPLGAAMACRADYLHCAGLLNEDYFLYYEEADWARRGAERYSVGWARDAVIYHRDGVAAGSRTEFRKRSVVSEFHMARSRLIFVSKWRPVQMPLALGLEIARAFTRLVRGNIAQMKAVLAGTFSALNFVLGFGASPAEQGAVAADREKKLRNSQPML